MKKKRVVVDASDCIVTDWRPFLSGIGRTTLELIRALESMPELPFELCLYSQRVHSERLQRYNFKSRQYFLPLPKTQWIEKAKRVLPIVETLTGADLYHIPNNCGGFFYGNKTVLTIHDAMMFSMPEDGGFSKEAQSWQRKAAERCRGILTCSQASKDQLLKYINVPEDKISVVYWGYDAETFKLLNPDIVQFELKNKFGIKRPYLFSVSCSTGRKRTPELIYNYLNCAKKDFPFDLVFVWSKIPHNILDAIKAHPAKEKIHCLAGVSNEDLALLYNGASYTVFPSLQEGFGLPILESMACGTPVLTTKTSSMVEIAGDAGLYLESLDSEEIGEKLLMLAQKQFERSSFVKRSLDRVKNFSWDKCVAKTIEFYSTNIP